MSEDETDAYVDTEDWQASTDILDSILRRLAAEGERECRVYTADNDLVAELTNRVG